MPGGPVLNGGYPVEKRLATDPQMPQPNNNSLIARQAVFEDLRRKGLLNTPELQQAAAEAFIVAMPGRIG